MKTRSIALGALTVGVVGLASLLGVSAVSAATDNPTSSLVQKIADKFHLNKDAVQKVFDENHTQRKEEMKQNLEDRLTQLVKDGKITEEQKTKILTKLSELKNKHEKSKDLTREQRHEEMKQTRDDLKAWAKDNGIDEKYLLFRMMGGPGQSPNH